MIPQMINLEAGAKPDAEGAYMGRLEGPTFQIRFNSLTALYPNDNGDRLDQPSRMFDTIGVLAPPF